MTWLLGMEKQGEELSSLRKIASNLTNFKLNLNGISQNDKGDRSLRVDKEYYQIARFNGASGIEKKYHVHKDSYVHDPNQEVHGKDLRKLTLVIFLNDGLDLENPDANTQTRGGLRLYTQGDSLDGVVDIMPRVGRAVLFRSEEVLHKVNTIVG